MEPIRPEVDSWLLDFVKNHTFSQKEFYEKRDGGIRLTLKLAPILAETVSLWSEKIESIIKQVKGVLFKYETPDFKNHPKTKTRV